MIQTILTWHNNAKQKPVTENKSKVKDAREISEACLVRTSEGYGDKVAIAWYIKPAPSESEKTAFWANANGEKLDSKVLYWAGLGQAIEFISGFCVELS